jgi:hypothetical protein
MLARVFGDKVFGVLDREVKNGENIEKLKKAPKK